MEKVIRLNELQPTDMPREESQIFFNNLTLEEIQKRIGFPQVWKTDLGLLISDGNQRIISLAKRGHDKIRVNYNETSQTNLVYFMEFIDEIKKRAKNFREDGVYTPYDFP